MSNQHTIQTISVCDITKGHNTIEYDPDIPEDISRVSQILREKIESGHYVYAQKSNGQTVVLKDRPPTDQELTEVLGSDVKTRLINPPVTGGWLFFLTLPLSITDFYHRFRSNFDGPVPAQLSEDERLRRTRDMVRQREMAHLREQLYHSGSSVEEAPFNITYTGTRRFTDRIDYGDNIVPPQNNSPILFDLGYRYGDYADDQWERRPKRKTRIVRIMPPRRGFDRRLTDWPEHFIKESYLDANDTEVIQIPFSITIDQANFRMSERRHKMAQQKQFRDANTKSFELLREWITREEYESLMGKGELNIVSGKYLFTVYRNAGDSVRIYNMAEDRNLGNFCLVCREGMYPDGDTLLTKIMLIKTDPEAYLQIGCN